MTKKKSGVPSGLSYRAKSKRFYPTVVLVPVGSTGELSVIVYSLKTPKVKPFLKLVTEWLDLYGPKGSGKTPSPSSVETFALPVRVVGVPGSDVWEVQEGVLANGSLWVHCAALSFSFGSPAGTGLRSITAGALAVLKHHAGRVGWELHETQA